MKKWSLWYAQVTSGSEIHSELVTAPEYKSAIHDTQLLSF